MKIALLGSQSPIKLAVCKAIFASAFEREIIAYAASSGVNEQPFGEETMRGAYNRINTARNLIPQADCYLSIENGIFEENGKYIDRGVVVIEMKDGTRVVSKSEGVEFPAQYVDETRLRSGGFQCWTVGKIMAEHGVVRDHADPHKDLDPHGRSREEFLMQAARDAVAKLRQIYNPNPKILHGICGIGNGHTFRQLPVVEHFAQSARMVLFTYGRSHEFYSKRFENQPNVKVIEVANPFYIGRADGLDFGKSSALSVNQGTDYFKINAEAMAQVKDHLGGHPDLVVSDYEMAAAQYAYSCGAPLVTFDQQSKYLASEFPQPLGGEYVEDEIQRLRMFFPKAEKRLASTFFKVAEKADAVEKVELCAPVLSERITALKRNSAPDGSKNLIVYISSQQPFGQSLDEVIAQCESLPDVKFHVFSKGLKAEKAIAEGSNVQLYEQGDPAFHDRLAMCDGIISTAGHTLLSEAMYLGIPVYAIPLPLYEQQMNAHVIAQNKFGVSRPRIDADDMASFVRDLPDYASSIQNDKKILLRKDGRDEVILHLNAQLIPS